jgi:hypothetical protein
MGLFSSKKVISVASGLSSLAGDPDLRQNYLKSTLFSLYTQNNNKAYLGENLIGSYLKGPGILQRLFFNSAVSNDYYGLPVSGSYSTTLINGLIVAPFIPVPGSPSGLETEVTLAFISSGQFVYYAEQWLLENEPAEIDTDWISEYDQDTHTITIQYEGGGSDTFSAGDYSPDNIDIIAYHFHQITDATDSLVSGTLVEDVIEDDLPSDVDYFQTSESDTTLENFPSMNVKTTVTTTYSDATPPTEDITNEPFSDSFLGKEYILFKREYFGGDPYTGSRDYFYHLFERREVLVDTEIDVEVEVIAGVTVTTTTTVETDYLSPIFDYRIDTQDRDFSDVQPNQIYIYTVGSGESTLDDLAEDIDLDAIPEYYPFFPVRINNISIDDSPYSSNGAYEDAAYWYKKATGAEFNDIIDAVNNNDDIDEMDYVYVTFGVPLNSLSNHNKKYIYQYLRSLIPLQNTSSLYMQNFIANIDDFVGEPSVTTIRLKTDDSIASSYDIRLSWVNIQESFHDGSIGDVGTVELEVEPTPLEWTDESNPSYIKNNILEIMYVYKQLTETTYSMLTVYGLIHENYIYGGKRVLLTTTEALEEPGDPDDREDSGFLLPLHNPTMKALSLVDSTQIAIENMYLVVNSYAIYKKKWYETGFFKILIVIAVIVVSVLINPTALAAAPGILGTNIAVGTAIGLAGTAAIIAGAILNAFVAIIVVNIITAGASEIFGEKFGAIIGSVLSFVVSGGFDFSSLTNLSLTSVDNLLKITNVLANAYNGWIQSNIIDINDQLTENQNEYEKNLNKVNKLLKELSGVNDFYFNPMQLTDINLSQLNTNYLPESLDEFVQRTTLVGSDIVEITLAMINDYAELSKQLPRN